MNFEENGPALFKIKNYTNKNKEKIVYFENDKKNSENPFEEINLKGEDFFQLIPNKDRERSVLFIAGMSGSGKSYFCWKYIEEYHKIYKDRPCYLFSGTPTDDNLDKLKYLKRIKIDEKFLDSTLTIKDFEKCLILFDDCDVIRNKQIRTKIMNIQNLILQTGRHSQTECLVISHVINAGIETKIVLNEAHSITIFPRTVGARNLKYLLENYLGFNKIQIQKIKELGQQSRSITLLKTYPNIILCEKYVTLFDTLKNN